MGYYIRVLTKSDAAIPLPALALQLKSDGIKAVCKVEEGTEESWSQLILTHQAANVLRDGEIAVIERNPVESGGLGEAEIQEFLDELDGGKPESAAEWLRQYLPKIKVIYCFQILHGAAEWNNGWDAVHSVKGAIWSEVGGIFQADSEGFSNEDGYHILWQFTEKVSGPWKMAVLRTDGRWIPFEMDLGNRGQREGFWQGQVPPGAKRL